MGAAAVLLRSPWRADLRSLASATRRRALIASPYLTARGWGEFLDAVPNPPALDIQVCTRVSADSVASGSLDMGVLHKAQRALPRLRVHHIPGLHAKVYVSDGTRAIVTSGNLTHSSLNRNLEYGVRIADRTAASEIERDMDGYIRLGCELFAITLRELASLAEALCSESSRRGAMDAAAEFDDMLLRLRGARNQSRTGLMANAVIHLLRSGPLTTPDLHPLVKELLPDLCDDEEDRVINGVRFGKKWKHDVRNVQQQLKRAGRIQLSDGHWRLRDGAGGR